jgi:NAD(P)-dependent dehydrogenase (short-subunit alcohol dehydrogenase family)
VDARAARLVENETLFREVNERVEEVAAGLEGYGADERQPIGFVCECGRDDCTEPLEVMHAQYEAVRKNPLRFLVVPGHEQTDAARVVERHPRIGMVVNNAGVAARDGFLSIEPERLERVFAVNFFGTVWPTRAFLPALEAGAPSHLVNMSSVAGTVAFGPYSASKHAQLAFSRTMASQLRARGIRVLSVKPGYIETEGFPQRSRMGPFGRLFVRDPEYVVERILKAVDRGRTELTAPWFYWPASAAQALLPGLVSRFTSGRLDR